MNRTSLSTLSIGVALALALPAAGIAADQRDTRPASQQMQQQEAQQQRQQQTTARIGTQQRMAGTAERPGQGVADARREAIIWTTFATNPNLRETDIEVEVRRNTAILTGSVESQAELDLAETLARSVQGITRVENRLEIDPDFMARTGRDQRTTRDGERDFGTVVSDATTTAQVKSKLLWNTQTSGMDINVDTHRGRVTLEGTVDSRASRQLAEQLARNTSNVVAVENRLEVDPDSVAAADDGRFDGDRLDQRGRTAGAVAAQDRDRDDRRVTQDERSFEQRDRTARDRIATTERESDQPVNDAWITTKVKSTLLFSRNVSGTDVEVETNNGIVRLSGQVDSNAERQIAIDLARDIRGVRNVDASALVVDTLAGTDD
jgi:hyperosmotically inducible periplasmic protein